MIKITIPSKIYCGIDSIKELKNVVKNRYKKALIVSSSILNNIGYIKSITDILNKNDISYIVYDKIDNEPTQVYVDEGIKIFKDEKCDFILSFGGGSCIDTAKAISVFAYSELNICGTHKNITTNFKIPHISIPTTAGTGSEVTDVCVITNTITDVKMMIKNILFLPDAIIIDPIFTLTTPKIITASSSMDALSHAIESYISNKSNTFTKMFSIESIKLIFENIEDVIKYPDNINLRYKMSLAAMYAGIAFSNSSVTVVHGMSRPLGALFHIPHGLSNAMILPAVLEFLYENIEKEIIEINSLLLNKNDNLISRIKTICKNIEIRNLKEYGVDENEFMSNLDKMAQDALDSKSPNNVDSPPSKKDIIEIYKKCYNYKF